eukprot:TRINITY_DN3818_c0_g1_i1.p1 TRINITY_DN3818_c0_g1~~TRINITY_DN3818_c0_g1_i1.p1  ORF type:complete len:284 (-),score=59.70 TRINITY_DN3818_c0_g1_i1:153-1004(-)
MASCSRIVGLVRRSSRLCNLTRTSITQFKGFRTTAIMSEEQIEELKKNPYYSKYADKIAKLQNTSPEEFLSRLSAHEDRKKAQESEANQKQRDFSFPGQAKKATDSASSKSLDKVVKLDLLKDKTPEEITEIWTKHFSQQEKICAVIPAETYKKMQQRFQEFNTFLFPIPRKNGYEFVMVQFQGNEAHFTTLINFQAHKENAPECLNMVHYTELMEEKGVVLMVGEYDKDTLDPREAKCLADQVEIYYSNPNESRRELMNNFSKNSAFFNHNDLIKEFNNIAI